MTMPNAYGLPDYKQTPPGPTTRTLNNRAQRGAALAQPLPEPPPEASMYSPGAGISSIANQQWAPPGTMSHIPMGPVGSPPPYTPRVNLNAGQAKPMRNPTLQRPPHGGHHGGGQRAFDQDNFAQPYEGFRSYAPDTQLEAFADGGDVDVGTGLNSMSDEDRQKLIAEAQTKQEQVMAGMLPPAAPQTGDDYVDAPTGSLRATLEAQRQGESKYSNAAAAAATAAPLVAFGPVAGAAGLVASDAAKHLGLPEPVQDIAAMAPFVAGGGGGLLAKAGEAAGAGLGQYAGGKADEKLGLPSVPGLGGPLALAGAMAGGGMGGRIAESTGEKLPGLYAKASDAATRDIQAPPRAPQMADPTPLTPSPAGGAMTPEEMSARVKAEGLYNPFANSGSTGPEIAAQQAAKAGAARNSYGTALERTGDPGQATADARRAAALEAADMRNAAANPQIAALREAEAAKAPTGPVVRTVDAPPPKTAAVNSEENPLRGLINHADNSTPNSIPLREPNPTPVRETAAQGMERANAAASPALAPSRGDMGAFDRPPVSGPAPDPLAQEYDAAARIGRQEGAPPAAQPSAARGLPDFTDAEYAKANPQAPEVRSVAGIGSEPGRRGALPEPPETDLSRAIGKRLEEITGQTANGDSPAEVQANLARPKDGFESPVSKPPLSIEDIDKLPDVTPERIADISNGTVAAKDMAPADLISMANRLGVSVDEGAITRGTPLAFGQEAAKVQPVLDQARQAAAVGPRGSMGRAEDTVFNDLKGDAVKTEAQATADRADAWMRQPVGATTATGAGGAPPTPPAPKGVSPGPWREAVALVRAPLRPLLAGGHVLRIGVGTAVTHPPEAYTALRGLGRSLVSPESARALRGEVDTLPFVRGDGTAGLRAADFRAAEPKGQALNKAFIDKAIDRIPVVGTILNRLSDGGQMYLGILRDSVYNTTAETLKRTLPNADPKMYKDLYTTIAHNTGHATLPGLRGNGVAQGLGIGPNALASRFQSLADPFIKSGAPVPFIAAGARAEAIRSLLGVAAVMATTDALGQLFGAQVTLPFNAGPIKASDITSPYGVESKLFKVTTQNAAGTAKTTYSGGSGYDTLFRLFGNAGLDVVNGDYKSLEGHLTAWARGQVGPVPGKVIDLLAGQDWKGDPYNFETLKGEAKKAFIGDWAPIAAHSMWDAYHAWGPEGLLRAAPSLGAFETSTTPISAGSQAFNAHTSAAQEVLGDPTNLAKAFPNPDVANAVKGGDYKDLLSSEKAAVLANASPETKAKLDALAQDARAKGDPYQLRNDVYDEEHQNLVTSSQSYLPAFEQLQQRLLSGQGDPHAIEQAISKLGAQQRAEQAAIKEEAQQKLRTIVLPESKGTPAEKSDAQATLDAYRGLYDKTKGPDGKQDYGKLEQAQKTFISTLDPAMAARITEATKVDNSNKAPVQKFYDDVVRPVADTYFNLPTAAAKNDYLAKNPHDEAILKVAGYGGGYPFIVHTAQAAEEIHRLNPGAAVQIRSR